MNARASENYLEISRSSSASKSVEIFWAEIYWGRLFFRAESSFNSIQFKALFRVDINHTYNTSSNDLLKSHSIELSFLAKSQKLTSV